MIKIKSVRIEYSENSYFQQKYNGESVTCKTLRQASDILLACAARMTTDLGYDKTHFVVEWEDGWRYNGRYDLHKHPGRQENPNGFVDLADHIQEFLRNAICGKFDPFFSDKTKADLAAALEEREFA